jgi:hypothetical protein
MPIKQYQLNNQPASQPKVRGRQCDNCNTFTPFSNLTLYQRDFLQYATFNQEDRVGKMVCPNCLPPGIFNSESNVRTASKIDLLFAEIFKSEE